MCFQSFCDYDLFWCEYICHSSLSLRVSLPLPLLSFFSLVSPHPLPPTHTERPSNDPSGINVCSPVEILVVNLTKISSTINTFLVLPIVRVSANLNSKKVSVL